MFPDIENCTIDSQPAKEVLKPEFISEQFITKVSKRGAEIIDVMGKSSAASAANAACNHVYDWLNGTKPGQWVAMGVIAEQNEYGVPEGICFSYPIQTIKGGEWKIAGGLTLNDEAKERIEKNSNELLEERKIAFNE